MSRRGLASTIATVGLLVVFLVVLLVPVPYVVYRPGPTVNLLQKVSAKEGGYVVRVSDGTRTYRDDGALRLLTVSPSGADGYITLAQALTAWVKPSEAVYKYDDIYAPDESADDVKAENQVAMVGSQDSAVAAALRELGYKVPTSVQILGIARGGPGDGAFDVRDRIVSVDGQKVGSVEGAVSAVQAVKPGATAAVVVVRDGKQITVRVKTVASADDPTQSALKVTVGQGYDFPVQVTVRIPEAIGGPSAGMMFAMSIYDTLTPGSLTGDSDIAGTGTIDAKGAVGAIGGIQQKLVAAQAAGAKLFLAPASNCDEVRGGPYDQEKMRVVKVSTFAQALDDVNAWREDHDAKLPTC
ncbi:hypothetical protein GCM10011519_14100 [Marmoricola endophyticus]|uniref:endopeptidase La n=1 Tax=Marmoricola endophyticus TaxID=2040280 RepID=A0A917F2B7_9ACTN|nr:S16 family serine protease [Marmoricola endophyticus]GGF41479.1 hypothetical protein GCM10011519_14100 [Marmoricola endophyticus]